MPWWSIIYVFLFLTAIGSGIFLELRQRSASPVASLFDGLSALICMYLFVSYWIVGWRTYISAAAPYLYVGAIGWQIFDSVKKNTRVMKDVRIPKQAKLLIFVGIFSFIAVGVIVSGLATFK